MSTATPTTCPVTTLSSLPPRPRNAATAWARLFLAPEAARQALTGLGPRFVLDVPLMPTMLWTSCPDDVRAVFQDKTGRCRSAPRCAGWRHTRSSSATGSHDVVGQR